MKGLCDQSLPQMGPVGSQSTSGREKEGKKESMGKCKINRYTYTYNEFKTNFHIKISVGLLVKTSTRKLVWQKIEPRPFCEWTRIFLRYIFSHACRYSHRIFHSEFPKAFSWSCVVTQAWEARFVTSYAINFNKTNKNRGEVK